MDKVQKEEDSLIPIFIAMKKFIMPSNAPNAKEG